MCECIAILFHSLIYFFLKKTPKPRNSHGVPYYGPNKIHPRPTMAILDAAAPPGCPSSFATGSRWGRTYPPPIP